jgi:hypothetical protein
MTNSEQAIREILEKYDEMPYSDISSCLSDLTAFISEHYVSKEDVNQEVEKRIAGVMPTKNEIGNAAQLFDKQKRPLWKEAIWRAGANWAIDIIRSRLSQKTEGGTK